MILKLLGINVRDKDEEIHFLIGILTVLVVVLFIIAYALYPDTFSLVTNYLSDLGVDVTANGFSNPISSLIFKLAMAIGGLSLLIFFLVSPIPLSTLNSKFNFFVTIGEIFGILASLFMPIIGLVPVDTNPSLHNSIGWIFFALISLAIISYSLFTFLSFFENRDPNTDIFLFVILRIGGLIGVVILLELLTGIIGILDVPLDLLLGAFIGAILLIGLVLLFLKAKLQNFVSFLNYVTSIFILGLIAIIIYFVYSTGLKSFIEIIFVTVLIIWAFINNAQAFLLSLKTK